MFCVFDGLHHLRARLFTEQMASATFVLALLSFVFFSCMSTASSAGTDTIHRNELAFLVVDQHENAITGVQRRVSRLVLRGSI
jgi:hypothetical protein